MTSEASKERPIPPSSNGGSHSDSYRATADYTAAIPTECRGHSTKKRSKSPDSSPNSNSSSCPTCTRPAWKHRQSGIPVLRPMQIEFPDDPAVAYLDRQYMLGSELLIAPVFNAKGTVEFYLPDGLWTNYLTGEQVQGPGWQTELHGFDSIPIYVREGAVLPIGARDDRPDYDYLDGISLTVYPTRDGGTKELTVTEPGGRTVRFAIMAEPGEITITTRTDIRFSGRLAGAHFIESADGTVTLGVEPPG